MGFVFNIRENGRIIELGKLLHLPLNKKKMQLFHNLVHHITFQTVNIEVLLILVLGLGMKKAG